MPALKPRSWYSSFGIGLLSIATMYLGWAAVATPAKDVVGKKATPAPTPRDVAAEVDRLIVDELAKAGVQPTGLANDEDFLRRVSLQLVGSIPSASAVTLFTLDPDPDKRAKLIDRLLDSDEFADNWSRYWRDVIYMRATEQRSRLSQDAFETWMASQLKAGTSWDQIVTSLLTATGDVRENGDTALMFAQGGQPEEIAAETSRIFLGIQIQCANCHDHPTDKWKRKDFHELAAFFPRVTVRRKYGGVEEMKAMESMESMDSQKAPSGKKNKGKGAKKNAGKQLDSKKVADAKKRVDDAIAAEKKKRQGPLTFEVASYSAKAGNLREQFFMSPELAIRRLDKDGDKLLSREELQRTPAARIFDRLLEQADENKDKKLSAAEIKSARPPDNAGRGSAEYHMPDLNDPASPGKQIDPSFFLTGASPKKGMDDVERRQMLARYLTSRQNIWFARAYVNRIWGEMFGAAFYMPVDDMGPQRTAVFPQVLEVLSNGFVDSGYDVRWLFRAIANTSAFQRQTSPESDQSANPSAAFAASVPKRLRADQVYDSIVNVVGSEQLPAGVRQRGDRRQGILRSPRGQFDQLFGFDPSTPPDEIIGTVPQALFLMNSGAINRLVQARDGSRLKRILDENKNDADAVSELYLLVLGRTATENEVKTCVEYRNEVGDRSEAFEDIFWGLLNSSEFLSQR